MMKKSERERERESARESESDHKVFCFLNNEGKLPGEPFFWSFL